MIPTRRFITASLILAALGLVPLWYEQFAALWISALALLLVVALGDFLVWRGHSVTVVRQVPLAVSLDSWVDVTLQVSNAENGRKLALELFDHYPETFEAEGMPANLVIEPGNRAEVTYRVRPMERGPAEFGGTDLRLESLFGLWKRRARIGEPSTVRVYPNYSTVSKQLAYQVDSNLQLAGLKIRQRRGEGTEFHQLRDYREGDAFRSIDWKATARVGRLIAREYQDERDQQVVVLLDTGRRMLAKDLSLSHFDHTLNAMLLLCYVALRQGDAAGVMTMGDGRRFLPPRKGASAINSILNHVYSIQPDNSETDYIAAATDLAVRQRRRSLVVMLTNVREEDSDELQAAVNLLRQKHLVMIASLRERVLDDTLDRPVRNYKEALTFAATNQYLDARQDAHNLLRAAGVYVEDCLCEDLPAAITNRYLAIKRAGML